MYKNINCGTINKRGGAKNRLFKFVLCFCLGVVSLLGIGAKITANAQVLDISNEEIVVSDSSVLTYVLSKDYKGYYEVIGFDFVDTISCNLYFALYDFNGVSSFDYSLIGSYPRIAYGGTLTRLNISGYGASTYNGTTCYKVVLSNISNTILPLFKNQDIVVMLFKYINSDAFFCSKYLYNQYLTMQNSSSGYTDEDLQNSYNTGYSDCQNDMVDDLKQEWQNGYDIGKGEGVNEGINQGYQNGYNAGLNDNQDLIYNTGYNDGYSTGEDDGYNKGYDIGFSDSQNDKNSFKDLMFSIIDAPFNVLGNAFDFEIFGINMSDFLIAIVSLLLVSVVIRKLM